MKIFLKSLAALLFLALSIWAIRSDSLEERGSVVNAEPLPASPVGDASWRRDPLWDDGKAELCAYEVLWTRYGNHYPGRALLILVKEPWNDKLDVKADDPAASPFDVLKLNHVRDVATGIYTYHQMASVYLRRWAESIAGWSDEGRTVHCYFDNDAEGAAPRDALRLLEMV